MSLSICELLNIRKL